MNKRGPFGLWMGMQACDIVGSLEEIAPCKFLTTEVPIRHSAFARYVLRITPKNGLSWIKALGDPIRTNVYGVELIGAFKSMEEKLVTAYGAHKLDDFLMSGSIWSEPREWMEALLSGERVLMGSWGTEHRSSLIGDLSSVALLASASEINAGYIAIEYEFNNHDMAVREIAALEDDAL